jgi:hypothetical protein
MRYIALNGTVGQSRKDVEMVVIYLNVLSQLLSAGADSDE